MNLEPAFACNDLNEARRLNDLNVLREAQAVFYLTAGLTSAFSASRQSTPSGSTRSTARIE
jgi:hypothetical protein